MRLVATKLELIEKQDYLASRKLQKICQVGNPLRICIHWLAFTSTKSAVENARMERTQAVCISFRLQLHTIFLTY